MADESKDAIHLASPSKFRSRQTVLSASVGHARLLSTPLVEVSNRKSERPGGPKREGAVQQIKHSSSLPRPRAQSFTSSEAPRLDLTDFDLLKKIGQGGFGEVYICRKKDSNEILAMKIMEKSLIWKKNKTQQIKNERDVLARGLTEYMVGLHYSFQDRLYLYLAMEYCPGGDLYRVLQNFQSFSEEDARLYMAEMTMAVHSLHRLGYIHRDLKPDNFLIDKTGHLKLADFGLTKEGVRSFTESPAAHKPHYGHSTTKGFSVVGSPDYMAPEVLQRSPAGYGQEVDWWSIGCVFFDMIVGYPPFSGESAIEVFENISNWETVLPDIIEQHWDSFSANFLNLILGLLCNPEQRLGKDIDKLFDHPFFEGIQWNSLDQEKPLFVPQLENDLDVKYFTDINPTPVCSPNPGTPSKRARTSNFQAYYKHKVRTKEEAEKKLSELQEKSLRKMIKQKEKKEAAVQPPHFVSPPPNFTYDFKYGKSESGDSQSFADVEKQAPSSPSDGSEAPPNEHGQIPSWATPMKSRWVLDSTESDDEGFLIKTRSTPAFATPTKNPLSPEKLIVGFTFERKSARKNPASRVTQTPNRAALPSMKLTLCEEEEEEEEEQAESDD